MKYLALSMVAMATTACSESPEDADLSSPEASVGEVEEAVLTSDGPVAPGEWRKVGDGAWIAAQYGNEGETPLLALACNEATSELAWSKPKNTAQNGTQDRYDFAIDGTGSQWASQWYMDPPTDGDGSEVTLPMDGINPVFPVLGQEGGRFTLTDQRNPADIIAFPTDPVIAEVARACRMQM